MCAGVCLGRVERVWAWTGVWACSSKFFENVFSFFCVFFVCFGFWVFRFEFSVFFFNF